MARSPKDDPLFNDMQHNAWNYCEPVDSCAPGAANERKQPPISSNTNGITENSMYAGPNYDDVYNMNKIPYNVQAGDTAAAKDKLPYNLHLGNGQVVQAFLDENNRQIIVPITGQYELFNHSQGLRDLPLQASQPSHMFTLNQEYTVNNNNHVPPTTPPGAQFNSETSQNITSNFLKEVLGNWEPNSSGTYSPFGNNFPLNHPDAPSINMHPTAVLDPINQTPKQENSPKRNKTSPLADTSNKKRIVAEVKPMRPTYSDVLTKNKEAKNPSPTETTKKLKPQNIETKPSNKTVKQDKPTLKTDETKLKNEKKLHTNTISSGSESGDINTDDLDKRQKPNKKSKNKRNNISRKWSSLDNITNEEDASYNENESQFVFIENQSEKTHKKEKKSDNHKNKNTDKLTMNEEFKLDEEDDKSQFVFQDGQSEIKARKKKESRNYHKTAKPSQDKKKTAQNKVRRNKPGYLGLAQCYLEHWCGATWKAVLWFIYLLSDICGMSAHLSFDLCTSVFTQTYVSSQAVWRSSKEWLKKLGHNKYLMYIDRKLGHTCLGFWRKLKWFKKDTESDNGNDSSKLNANIPLPATGEEAMKRLLACKGKDPYSILGVSVTCTDDEIKRYYRRQAFLVHPDKNQQPGAEEAFKILQHAFELIGEPERRAAYERRALESRHAEAAWGELSVLLAQLHDKMEFAANTIRCTNCGRRHKRVLTDRPCYAARYCVQCKIRHSAKEGDIWAESSMMGLLVMYYACMDGAVYQITQWASCQKKNLKQLRPDYHVVQYRIVLGNKAAAAESAPATNPGHDPKLEEFLNNLYNKSNSTTPHEDKKRRTKKR